jgi:hypothetical protein
MHATSLIDLADLTESQLALIALADAAVLLTVASDATRATGAS